MGGVEVHRDKLRQKNIKKVNLMLDCNQEDPFNAITLAGIV